LRGGLWLLLRLRLLLLLLLPNLVASSLLAPSGQLRRPLI
jgi:hypothetical protein